MRKLPIVAAIFFCLDIFAARPVDIVCIGDRDYCTAELSRLMGEGYRVSTMGMDEAMGTLPDIVVIIKNFGDATYQTVKKFRKIPSCPDIFLTGDGYDFYKEASRAWSDVVPVADPESASPEFLAENIRRIILANGWGHAPRRRIVFAGDSITDGAWGKGDSLPAAERNSYDMNHFFGHGYMEKVASALLEKYPERNYKLYNRGIGGGRLNGLSDRWDSEILSLKPDIISIFIGVNDSSMTAPEEFAEWEKTYRSLMDRTLERYPDCKFVLCTPFSADRGDVVKFSIHPERRKATDRLDIIVKNIARDYGAVIVDFVPLIDGLIAKDKSTDHNYWVWDGVHPTAPAHSKMARLWIRKASSLL